MNNDENIAIEFINAEFSTFKEKFIIPFMASESDKNPFVVSGISNANVTKNDDFYTIRFDIHGKTAYIRYSTVFNISVPSLQVEQGKIQLHKIFDKLFSMVNYIAFNSSDEEFMNWLRNSDARLVITYNYYIIGDKILGKSEFGIYKNNKIIFSAGVMNNGKVFYPAYFKLTKEFLRLKTKTQEKIVTTLLKNLFSVKKISNFRVKGFDNVIDEEVTLSNIIADMTKRVLPTLIKMNEKLKQQRLKLFQNDEKPIGYAYEYNNGKLKTIILNSNVKI